MDEIKTVKILLSVMFLMDFIVLHHALESSKGFVTSPGYPDRFPATDEVRTLIELPDPNSTVLVKFTVLDISSAAGSNYPAHLYLYDGRNTSNKLLASFTGNVTNILDYQSSGPTMLFRFTSEYGGSGAGFHATYDSVTSEYLLNENETGVITSDNYPNNYSDSQITQWSIIQPERELVRLEFKELETEACCDWIEVRNGADINAPSLGEVSGNLNPDKKSFVASGNGIFVRFITDGSGSARGFTANYYPGTKETLGHPFGEFHSQNHPNNYTSWNTEQWVISLPEINEKVYLEFKSFQTESNKDTLTIRDGSTDSSQILGVYSGSNIPPIIISSGPTLFLSFTSDGSNEFSGFAARYESVGADVTVQTTEDPVPVCISEGVYNIPYPGDCQKYYLCVNYLEYEQTCSEGLYFDSTLGECNRAENVVCEWMTTTTEAPICPSEGVVFIPVPENCSAYILCADGVPMEHICPTGTLFDPLELKCKLAEEVKCTIFCPDEGIQYFPRPGTCSEYILCSDGEPNYRTCPNGTLFDPIELKCKLAEDVQCLILMNII